MFRYSDDELIAGKQKEEATKLITDLSKKCVLVHSPELEKAFTDFKITYEFLHGVKEVADGRHENLVIIAIKRNHTADGAQWDLKKGFDKLEKSWKDPIPYIEHSFKEDYKSEYGDSMNHAFFFFFTKYHDYEGSRDCMLYYLEKFYNLRAFT